LTQPVRAHLHIDIRGCPLDIGEQLVVDDRPSKIFLQL